MRLRLSEEIGPLDVAVTVLPQLINEPFSNLCAACGQLGPTSVALVYTLVQDGGLDTYVTEYVHRSCVAERARDLGPKAQDELTVVLGTYMEDAINAWLGTHQEAPQAMVCETCGVLVSALVEDPYEADVNNKPGVMVALCPACLDECAGDI